MEEAIAAPTPPLPTPVPGPQLAESRKRSGVTQAALAGRLGLHRITLNRWESELEVDAIRAARYTRALVELLTEAVA